MSSDAWVGFVESFVVFRPDRGLFSSEDIGDCKRRCCCSVVFRIFFLQRISQVFRMLFKFFWTISSFCRGLGLGFSGILEEFQGCLGCFQ